MNVNPAVAATLAVLKEYEAQLRIDVHKPKAFEQKWDSYYVIQMVSD